MSETCDRLTDHAADQSGETVTPLDCFILLDLYKDESSMICGILGLFIEETLKDMDDLIAARGSHNSDRLAVLAHRVKGAAASIGARSLREGAALLEASGRKGDLAAACDRLTRLQAEFESFRKFIAQCAFLSGSQDQARCIPGCPAHTHHPAQIGVRHE
jgi:HPt (histidine-containing phosphotransfer) domain-containing protein